MDEGILIVFNRESTTKRSVMSDLDPVAIRKIIEDAKKAGDEHGREATGAEPPQPYYPNRLVFDAVLKVDSPYSLYLDVCNAYDNAFHAARVAVNQMDGVNG